MLLIGANMFSRLFKATCSFREWYLHSKLDSLEDKDFYFYLKKDKDRYRTLATALSVTQTAAELQ